MNRIVILGNGFDMAHKLPTGYRDFIKFLHEGFVSFTKTTSEHQIVNGHKLFYFTPADAVQLNGSQPRRAVFKLGASIQSWDDLKVNTSIEYMNGAVHKAQISFKNKLLGYVFTSSNSVTWGGFENDYKDVLTRIIQKQPDIGNGIIPRGYTVNNLNEDLGEIIELLYKYLKEQIIYPTTLDPVILSRLLVSPKNKWRMHSRYVAKYGEIPVIDKPDDTEDLNNVLFLSFNYTPTICNYLFKKENFDAINRCNLPYNSDNKVTTSLRCIHGDLDDDNPHSLIFGYGDELDENQALIENLEDEYLRHIKSVLYTRSPYYREVIDFADADKFDIVIYGHSCSNTDRTLLNTLFEHSNCVSIQPFLHNANDMSIYTNIYRCFKDKKLMRSRVVDQTNTIRA